MLPLRQDLSLICQSPIWLDWLASKLPVSASQRWDFKNAPPHLASLCGFRDQKQMLSLSSHPQASLVFLKTFFSITKYRFYLISVELHVSLYKFSRL